MACILVPTQEYWVAHLSHRYESAKMQEYIRGTTEKPDTSAASTNALPRSRGFHAEKVKRWEVSAGRTYARLWGVPLGTGKRAGHAGKTRSSELSRRRGIREHCVRTGASDVSTGRRHRLAAGSFAPPRCGRGGGVHFLALPAFSETNERTPPASRAARPGA